MYDKLQFLNFFQRPSSFAKVDFCPCNGDRHIPINSGVEMAFKTPFFA